MKGGKKFLSKSTYFVFFGAVLFLGIWQGAFAEGHDLLAGTDADLISTIQGTGKKYLYASEVIIASVGYLKTRQATAFLGIGALAVGFNVLLTFLAK